VKKQSRSLTWSAVSVVVLFSPAILIAFGALPRPLTTGSNVLTGSTAVGRFNHTATLLGNGKVLVAGGMARNGVWLKSAEIYDPARGEFQAVHEMHDARAGAVAVLLPNGQVLIAGGATGAGRNLASAELFDAAGNRFLSTGNMTTPRTAACSTLLQNGKVLIVGGSVHGDDEPLKSAELYDPATGTFAPTGSMRAARSYFASVQLRDGRLLVMGGISGGHLPDPTINSTAEIYDPSSGHFSSAGTMDVARYKHGAALLPDGRALIVGGQTGGAFGALLATTEIYDPIKNAFSAGPQMKVKRFKLHDGVVALPDGRVLVAGGADQLEVYDLESRQFSLVPGDRLDGFLFSTATLLQGNKVLLVNGYAVPPAPPSRHAWIYGGNSN
jgi:Kelch motif/Galactose oxidase, central domain